MACHLFYDDRPMTVAQMFAYIRHRYDGLQEFFLEGRDVIVVPLLPGTEEAACGIRELAARKGLSCSQVSAAWPEYAGPDIATVTGASDFLVIAAIRGGQPRPI